MSDIFTGWPDLITRFLVVVCLSGFIWSLVYIVNFGLSGLREAVLEFSGFSFYGFSARRIAYFFVVFDLVLTVIHWQTSRVMDGAIMFVALMLSLAILVLSFFIPRTAQGRFLPLAFSVLLILIHSVLCKA